MGYEVAFEQRAIDNLDALDIVVAQRIVRKIKWLASQQHVFAQSKTLTDPAIGQYRFRVGDYRIVFDIQADLIIVRAVGHRKDIYR